MKGRKQSTRRSKITKKPTKQSDSIRIKNAANSGKKSIKQREEKDGE
jgi:hypothetical protein